MRYVQLRAFHHVAVAGGFSRAAEVLHLTQPAISDQVRKLEAEYDVRLFNREKKQVTLTREGSKLLEITRRLFEVEGQAQELLSQSRMVKSGKLAIIADSAHHVTNVIGPFREKHPGVFVSIAVGNSQTVLSDLASYAADIGVLGQVPEGDAYDVIELSSTPIIAFASANGPFAERKSIEFDDLAQLPLVMREKGSRTRAKVEELARSRQLELDIKIEAEGREAVREIVACGEGLGLVSQAEFGRDARLIPIEISNASLTMDEALICLRERRDSMLVRAFMDVARDAARNQVL
ncbi:MAG: LysR substrate-binding domain-containing protein [Rhizobiaceae bacterium]